MLRNMQSARMDDDDARDRRQLDLMLDRLARFRSGDLAIGSVINDLEALHHELNSVNDEWIARFREAWSDLEIPYAVALDRRHPIPTIADPTVAEGIDEIEYLVQQALTALDGPR